GGRAGGAGVEDGPAQAGVVVRGVRVVAEEAQPLADGIVQHFLRVARSVTLPAHLLAVPGQLEGVAGGTGRDVARGAQAVLHRRGGTPFFPRPTRRRSGRGTRDRP